MSIIAARSARLVPGAVMIKRLGLGVLAALAVAGQANAAGPATAVVEQVDGTEDVATMDLLGSGTVVDLGSSGTLTVGYFESCWEESITGGTVTIGQSESKVEGGKVERTKIECNIAPAELSAAQSEQSGVIAFRTQPTDTPLKPERILGTTTPVFRLTDREALVIERVDGRELPRIFPPAQGPVIDFAALGIELSPGVVYRVKTPSKLLIMQVAPNAKSARDPLLARMLVL